MKLLVLLALVGMCFAAVEIKLTKIMSPRTRLVKAGLWPAYRKYKEAMRIENKAANKVVVQNPVNDYEDFEYVANVTLGTPEQQFMIIPDTGSANLWVTDAKCKRCKGKHLFDQTKSTTYKTNGQAWSIQYGTGSAKGILGVDTFRIGAMGTTQLVIPNCIFGQATSIDQDLEQDVVDGIMGLAFQSLAVDNVPPPFVQACTNNIVDACLFTVFLQEKGATDNVPGGIFTYGGVDKTNCGPMQGGYVPLSSATYFQFKMDSIGIGSYTSAKSTDVISDTGTSFLGGPQTITDAMAQQAQATYDQFYGAYFISCQANPPPIKITIGGQQYQITEKQMIVDAGNGQCYWAIFPFDFGGFGPTWILGDPWIRQYCNIYNVGAKSIGFAPAMGA